MRPQNRVATLVVVSLLAPDRAAALRSGPEGTPGIEHRPVACVVAERFPQVEARFTPAETVAVARVVFQGSNAAEWYSVAMQNQGGVFLGTLPKPRKELKAFRYYIEATDQTLGSNRTPEYEPMVVGSRGECKGGSTAAATGSASVQVQGTPGAAPLPAGFSPSGVVATGLAAGSPTGSTAAVAGATATAGLSGVAIAGIAGGVAAAAVVAKAATGGGDSPSSTASGAPAPTPAPTPVPTPTPPPSFSGRWAGTVTYPASAGAVCPFSQPFNMDIAQTGANLSGSLNVVWNNATPETPLCRNYPAAGTILPAQIPTGTLNGATVTFTAQFSGSAWNFTGTVSGSSASGTVQTSTDTGVANGTWSASR